MAKWIKAENLVSFDDGTIKTLKTFGSSPAGFIFGIVLTPLLNGFETVVLRTLGLVNLLVYGDSRSTTAGMLGIADIPAMSMGLVIEAGNTIGNPLLNSVVGPFGEMLVDLANWAGPWGLLGAAIALVILANVFSESLRLLLEILIDALPGGGAFIN